eukprot:TRINITY_DN3388_c0_g1_i2.p1 TRINITY_DN3388_c0_g1~~TRINITY_DN3388_c0_g1_i2.p1  ORF type:complete len:222 (-),score=40.85 TRINITY_DN3388_c0_g1_i2:148-720(-)
MSVTIQADIATFNATQFVERLAAWFGVDLNRILVRNATAVVTQRRSASATTIWFEIADDPTTPSAPTAAALSTQLYDALTNGGSAPAIGTVLSVTPPSVVVVGGSTGSPLPATTGNLGGNLGNAELNSKSSDNVMLANGGYPIIIIVVGGVALVVAVVIVIVVVRRRRNKPRRKISPDPSSITVKNVRVE